tara:strand:+ start:58 stop:405 length:348 start_codon:yes stop_codon:yes gene_type:complete
MYKVTFDKFIIAGLLWVILVSLLDHYLTIKLQDTIIGEEKNPIGLFLIIADGGSVALFMTLKMFFLWAIVMIVLFLYRIKKSYAYVSLTSLCIAQAFLLYFFLFGQVEFGVFTIP